MPLIPIVYVTREDPEGARGSLSEPVVADYGWQGARVGVDEINRSGQFLGKQYRLERIAIAAAGDIAAATRTALTEVGQIVIADLDAVDLRTIAALPEADRALILDARTSDDSLRQQGCRDNVFHLLPNWSMRTDALAQFLAQRHWTRWFLLVGPAPSDQAYAAAVKRSAAAVGARIVIERRYQPPARRAAEYPSELTHVAVAYDVLLTADTSGTFGESLEFNTWDPRLVAGTQGLTAVAWHPLFKEYAARGIQYRFFLNASRDMTERDYGNWLAATVIGEAVTRSGRSDGPECCSPPSMPMIALQFARSPTGMYPALRSAATILASCPFARPRRFHSP